MAHRNPARFLAPLALVAFVVALFMVVSSTTGGDGESGAPNEATETRPASSPGEREERREDGGGRDRGPRRYTVEPGDTPTGIAEKTGVPLEELLRLNPDLDPQALTPGTRLRLRERGQ